LSKQDKAMKHSACCIWP